MRKIIAFTVLLMVAVSAYLGAEFRDYESSTYGYSGKAIAEFSFNALENDPDIQLDFAGRLSKRFAKQALSHVKEEWIDEGIEIVPKLSKQERWLIEQALEEWGTDVGDFFLVWIKPSDWDETRGLCIYAGALILDDLGRFEYVACVYTGDD